MSFSPFPFYAFGITLVFPAWPLTLVAAVSVAWGLNRRRSGRISPGAAPARYLALLLLPTVLILIASGFWHTESLQYIPNRPAHVTIFALLGAQALLSILVSRRMRDHQATAAFFVVPALYLTTVAAFLGLWAVGGGGSL